MRYEDFAEALNVIRPGSEKAALIWFEWAKEMERCDADGEPENPGKKAEEFLDEIVKQFHTAQEKHGNKVAGQLISLAEISSCIFSWEMRMAAEHLASGGSIYDILPMSKEGVLEDLFE